MLPVVLGAAFLGGWALTSSLRSTEESEAACPVGAPAIGHTISSSSGNVYEVPTAIDATGGREVSSELQGWLVDAVRSGTADQPSVIKFQPGGRYWVDYTLVLRKQGSGGVSGAIWPDLPKFSRDYVRIDLNGATLEQRTTQRYRMGDVVLDPRKRWGDPILMTAGATGVEITNGTISGANPRRHYEPAFEEWTGIRISGGRNDDVRVRGIWVHDISIRNVFGDFIAISAATSAGNPITDVLIEDNRMNVAGRQGIVLGGGTNLVIRRNDIRNAARLVFDSEPTAAQGWQYVTITENTGNASRIGYFQFSGPKAATASNISVVGNTITDGNFRVKVGNRADELRKCFTFSHNHNLGSAEYSPSPYNRNLIRIANWDMVTIDHNYDLVHPPDRVTAVDLEGSNHTSVTQNTWVDALDDQCPTGFCPEP